MAKRKKDRGKVPVDGSTTAPANNPFAALLAGRSAPEDAAPAQDHIEEKPAELPRKLRLRRERKDRGGKTVTVIEGLGALDDERLEALAKQVRKALGVGASVDGDAVVVQGDIGDRVEAFLLKSGVQKVSR